MNRDASAGLKTLVNWDDWGDSITLMANSGIQFLDFELIIEPSKQKRSIFTETKRDAEGLKDKYRKLDLLSLPEGEDPGQSNDMNLVTYEISALKSLDPFINNWIPIPFFRVSEGRVDDKYDIGPTTWSRMRIASIENAELRGKKNHSFRIQLALDTTIGGNDEEFAYMQPTEQDAGNKNEFRFVNNFEDVSRFLTLGVVDSDLSTVKLDDDPMWVTDWIKTIFERFLEERNENGREVNRKECDESKLEYWARYIAMLQVIESTLRVPKVRLLSSPYSHENSHAIDVDLILDIGNSRTCGLLIEQSLDDITVELSSAVQLELRDLSEPQYSYQGLFQSRVEFSDHNFGDERLARSSGRNNGFIWPSFVRIGPEAMKLVQSEKGTETSSGISSPKRYLWDSKLADQDWRFHQHQDVRRLPVSLNAALINLTPEGDHVEQIAEDIDNKLRDKTGGSPVTAIRPRFAKSSIYGFMVAEIIAHAFVQINSTSYRMRGDQKDIPRRLNRIILTLPTATPSQEQAIVKSKVSGALKMVWDRMLHWGQAPKRNMPELLIDWDEASCTQVMYLYSEIMAKYQGRMTNYLKIYGKARLRNNDDLTQSIKIACIDIGGGTTDLMVTTFFQEHEVSLVPSQEFREGFRVAGDDLVKEVIKSVILPRLKDTISDVSHLKIEAKFQELFAKNVANLTSTRRQLRRQFGLRILTPIALKLLEVSLQGLPEMNISVSEAFETEISEELPESLINYLQKEIRSIGANNWSLLDQELHFSHEEIVQVFERLFGVLISNIAEVIHKLNVDVILLTGRPSQNPIVRQMLVNSCLAPPTRIIAMHDYHTGSWYPFRNTVNKVGDPKSTVAVGAMLITMSDRNIPNFNIPRNQFKMKSTAKFIGRMQIDGQILDADIVCKPESDESQDEFSLKIMTPIFIGSRQLDVERWTTSRLYLLTFAPKITGIPPYTVTIRRRSFLGGHDSDKITLASEAIKEMFVISRIEDATGKKIPNKELQLTLQTLGDDGEYWLDTGSFLS